MDRAAEVQADTSCTPHVRKHISDADSSGRNSGVSTRGFALTLLIAQPLMPTDASSRA